MVDLELPECRPLGVRKHPVHPWGQAWIRLFITCKKGYSLEGVNIIPFLFRYHIIAEIMQATTINNLKGIEKLNQEETNQPLKKDSQLRSRNLKRYINQCTVAKAQCEKRIKLLGTNMIVLVYL